MNKFHVTFLTIFPEIFPGPLGFSLAGKALKQNIWSYQVINIRDFGLTKHKNVDDQPFGGGNGLIMRPDVLGKALDYALEKYPSSQIYYPSPRGNLLNQQYVKRILNKKNVIILCGRFEGIDERIIDEYNIAEISIGDYILSGGEIAALAILDSIIRILPGVMINSETINSESFEKDGEFAGLLECPLYTRPSEWKNRKVPDILLSGDHRKIKDWKYKQSELITKKRRPDLIK